MKRHVLWDIGPRWMKRNSPAARTDYICFTAGMLFLLAYIALSAVKTNFSYALMQKKLHAQQLQRENEMLALT